LNKYNFSSIRNPFFKEKKYDYSNFGLIGFLNNQKKIIEEPNESTIKSQSVLIDFIDIDSESGSEDNLMDENIKSKLNQINIKIMFI
jgi:hypothetical protein